MVETERLKTVYVDELFDNGRMCVFQLDDVVVVLHQILVHFKVVFALCGHFCRHFDSHLAFDQHIELKAFLAVVTDHFRRVETFQLDAVVDLE